MRLWIDTDLGDNPDDALAILMAAAHPHVELVGISTVHGDLAGRALLARDLLARHGLAVPLVYAGPPDPRALAAADALLAIGPLTNVAALVRRGVPCPPTAVMGGVLGEVHHRGAARTVDTNFGTDPHAAMVVLHGVPDLLLVPLDVTAPLATIPGGAAVAAALPRLEPPLAAWSAQHDAPLCPHDPAALLCLIGEAGAVIEARTLGLTVEGRLVDDDTGATVEVVVGLDGDLVWSHIAGLAALVRAAHGPEGD